MQFFANPVSLLSKYPDVEIPNRNGFCKVGYCRVCKIELSTLNPQNHLVESKAMENFTNSKSISSTNDIARTMDRINASQLGAMDWTKIHGKIETPSETDKQIQQAITYFKEGKYSDGSEACLSLLLREKKPDEAHETPLFQSASSLQQENNIPVHFDLNTQKIFSQFGAAALEFEKSRNHKASVALFLTIIKFTTYWQVRHNLEVGKLKKGMFDLGLGMDFQIGPEERATLIKDFLECATLAAKNDDLPNHAYRLAKIYHDGEIEEIPQSDLKAVEFYFIAVEKGCQFSKNALLLLARTTKCPNARKLIVTTSAHAIDEQKMNFSDAHLKEVKIANQLTNASNQKQIYYIDNQKVIYSIDDTKEKLIKAFEKRGEDPRSGGYAAYKLAKMAMKNQEPLDKVQKYYEVAMECYRTAACASDTNSTYKKAEFGYFEIAAAKGDAEAELKLGLLCFENSLQPSSAPWLSLIAKGRSHLEAIISTNAETGRNAETARKAALELLAAYRTGLIHETVNGRPMLDASQEASRNYENIAFFLTNKVRVSKFEEEFKVLKLTFSNVEKKSDHDIKRLQEIAQGTGKFAGEAAHILAEYYSICEPRKVGNTFWTTFDADAEEEKYSKIAIKLGNKDAIAKNAAKPLLELNRLAQIISLDHDSHLNQHSVPLNRLKEIVNGSDKELAGKAAFIIAEHYASCTGKKVSTFWSSVDAEIEADRYYKMSADLGNGDSIQKLANMEQEKNQKLLAINEIKFDAAVDDFFIISDESALENANKLAEEKVAQEKVKQEELKANEIEEMKKDVEEKIKAQKLLDLGANGNQVIVKGNAKTSNSYVRADGFTQYDDL